MKGEDKIKDFLDSIPDEHRTAGALALSVAHWDPSEREWIYSAWDRMHSKYCALCNIFYAGAWEECRGCPLQEIGKNCENPGSLWRDILSARGKNNNKAFNRAADKLYNILVELYAKESNKYLVFSRKGVDIERYPAIYEHLCQFRDVLEPCPKGHKGKWHGRKAGSYRWYELQDTIDYYSRFDKPKIVWPEFGKLPRFSWEEAGKYTTNKVYLMDVDSPWILGLLQSRVIWFCISQIATPLHIRGGLWRFQCFRQFISRLPVPKTTREDRLVLERLALNATEIANGRKILDSEVRHRISTDLGTIQNQMSKKLEFWWLLSFSEFRKEVKKTFNADILIKERAEWESTFEAWRKEHDRYTRAIIDVEKELNDHVFHLYGYTKDNIDRLEEHMQENKIFYQLGEV